MTDEDRKKLEHWYNGDTSKFNKIEMSDWKKTHERFHKMFQDYREKKIALDKRAEEINKLYHEKGIAHYPDRIRNKFPTIEVLDDGIPTIGLPNVEVKGFTNDVIRIIQEHQNPYPQDMFTWDNKEPMNITRGRFNEFIHSVVENTKRDIIAQLRGE